MERYKRAYEAVKDDCDVTIPFKVRAFMLVRVEDGAKWNRILSKLDDGKQDTVYD